MEMKKFLIETLVWKNVEKEALLKSQKNKSNSYHANIDQTQKQRGTKYTRTTKRFFKEVEHQYLANDIENNLDKIKTLSTLLKESTLNWFDREIKANPNYAKETTWNKVYEKLIWRFENKQQKFVKGMQFFKLK